MRGGGWRGLFLSDANAEALSPVMMWGRPRTRQFYAAFPRPSFSRWKTKKDKERKKERERERERESENSGRKYWFKTTKNQDISTGPRTCLFAHSLAPLTHLLALHGLLCLHVSLHSFICLLAHSFSQSQARWESEWLNVPTSGCSEP